MDTPGFLLRQQFGSLIELLQREGYRVIGPVLRDGAIVYTDIDSVDELPAGVLLQARPGRLHASETQLPRYFAWANGPQALKPLLFKPRQPLWQAGRDARGQLTFSRPEEAPPQAIAVVGVRACDLAALALQDRHFLHGDYADPDYRQPRERLLLIAVNCTHPAETCFCASTGDGPQAHDGFDLLLDELDSGFIIRAGSDAGRRLLSALALQPVRQDQLDKAAAATEAAAAVQTRTIPPGDLYDALASQRKHERWNDVAARCLSCGNCTLVCPTCFCSREQDEPQLDGDGSVHVREWDSCFNQGHSYIHGVVIRGETRYRYRQWLTHKLGAWHRQYGRSGCVGCGRCIAWCPVGIDLCEEVNVLLAAAHDA